MNELLLPNQRHLFDIPHEVAYFNCASLCPQMLTVRAAGEAALLRNSRPWKIDATGWFATVEELRTLFARLIGAKPGDIALIPATSYGLAVASANLVARPGDRVLVVGEDFPSTVYTWRAFACRTGAEILTVERDENQSWTEGILEKLDERVRVVSVPNVHWTNGALIDLGRVGERAREVGATFIVDATQSLGAMPFDVGQIRPDYLVAAGYKWLLGPVSIGYMYVDPARQSGMPIEQNWILRGGSEDFSSAVAYCDDYQPGARRFDVGQRTNFTLTPMALAALRQLLEWGVERIAATLSEITTRIEKETRQLGLKTLTSNQRGSHMLGIELPQAALAPVANELAANDIHVAIRGSYMRVSPHLYVTHADVDRLIEALAKAL